MSHLIKTILIAIVCAGCAGIDVESVRDNSDANGLRYYATSPFLLMYTDNSGGLTSKILYLPDMTKLRSIRPYNYLAKNDATLTFEEGRLVSAKAVVDETAIPSAVVSGLEKIASSLIAAANAGNEHTVPAPYLFRIDKDDQGQWILAGGQGKADDGTTDVNIRVTKSK